MLLLFDVATEALVEHDDWHTHEHMPERLAIPGFLRGTRWVAQQGSPRYCVLYEVSELAVLDSAAYRERLDHPTPWTAAMMRNYRRMRRTLCEIAARSGRGMGASALVAQVAAAPGREHILDSWLSGDVVPRLSRRPGLCSAWLLRNALPAPMTGEQRIRGRDAALDRALFVTGYDDDALVGLARNELAAERFAEQGAAPADCERGLFRQAFVLASADTLADAP